MRVAKTYVPRHLLSAVILASLAGEAMAQQPKPAPAPAAPAVVAPAVLKKLFDEAEKAFGDKDYNTVVAKLTELLKLCANKPEAPIELMMFNVGLAHLLQGNAVDAEKAFDECVKKFPKGEFASRCYLGIGKAVIAQGDEGKRPAAIEAFKKAAADPKFRTEAGLELGRVYIDNNQPEAALTVFRTLMGSDVRTPQQTAASVEVIGLLAATDQIDDLIYYLDRLITQPGVREAIAWYSNQVVVKGDGIVAEAGDSMEKWAAALAIYRSVPPRAQIMEVQAASLDNQRKELDLLKRRQEAEKRNENLGQRSNVGELIAETQAAITLTEEAKKAIEGLADLDAALLMRRGRCYYYLKRREEALMCFTTIREKHPQATDAQAAAYAEIVLYNELKDNNKIQDLANSFMTKYPEAPNLETVATLAGEVLVGTGDWKKVQAFYEDLASRFPQSPNIDRFRFFVAVAVFQQGEFLKSAEMLDKFVKDFPNTQFKEASMYRIAMGNFLENRYKETLYWCNQYLTTYPNGHFAGDMLYRLAFIDSNDKDVDQSDNIIKNLSNFLKEKPEDPAAGSMLCLLADTYKKKMSAPSKIAKDQKALEQWNKDNPPEALKKHEDGALEAYQKAVWTASPDDVIQYAMDEATAILQGRKDWQGIVDLHGRFMREKPDHQMALMSVNWVSKAMTRLGKPEEGAAMVAEVMAKSIGNPAKEQVEFLISEIVKAMVPRKREPGMLKELDEKLVAMLNKASEGKEGPTTSARIQFGRSQLATLFREPKTAETYLTNVANDENIPVESLSPTLLSSCGEILLKNGNLDRAEAMFRRLSDKYQESAFSDAGPVGMGQIALARKEPQKAYEIFEHAITQLPGMSRLKEAMFGKLEALRDLEKYDEAEALALKIVGDRSFRGRTVPKAYMVLAEVLRKKADKQDTKTSMATLKQAHAYYQRVYLSYRKELDLCAESYMLAAATAKQLGDMKLYNETLKALTEDPKLKDTDQAKKAKTMITASN